MFKSTFWAAHSVASEAKVFAKNARQRYHIEKALAEEQKAWDKFEQEQDRLDAAGL